MRETMTMRIRLDETSLIPVLLASLFHLSCLMIMFISLKFCMSLWRGLLVEVLLATYVHVIECFGTNTYLVNHCDFCHLRKSKLLFLCLRTSKTVNLEEFVSRYSRLSFVLNICTKIELYLQFIVHFVGIAHIFMFSVIFKI